MSYNKYYFFPYEDEKTWCIVEKTFWDKNEYIPEWKNKKQILEGLGFEYLEV